MINLPRPASAPALFIFVKSRPSTYPDWYKKGLSKISPIYFASQWYYLSELTVNS